MCGPRGLQAGEKYPLPQPRPGRVRGRDQQGKNRPSGWHYALSVSTLDYDEDGWPDIYVACDSMPSILYHNNRDGTFTDAAVTAGAALNEDGREQAGMGSRSPTSTATAISTSLRRISPTIPPLSTATMETAPSAM